MGRWRRKPRRHSKNSTSPNRKNPNRSSALGELLFDPDEVSRAGVHSDSKLGVLRVSENDVPDEFAGRTAPIASIGNWSIGIFGENFVPTMFFGCFKSFVCIELYELDVEHLRGRIA